MKNYTLNPVTEEWEWMTPVEWQRLKCGFGRYEDVPQYILDFKIDSSSAILKYVGNYPSVRNWILGFFVRRLILDPETQYKFCIFVADCWDLHEAEKYLKPIYDVRKLIHALNAETKERNSRSPRKGNSRKRLRGKRRNS